MSDANWDPFEESRIAFEDFNWILRKTIDERGSIAGRRVALLMYCQAVEMTAPHEILANLLRVCGGQPYLINPFSDLYRRKKNTFWSSVPPSAKQKFQRIQNLAAAVGNVDIVAAIKRVFNERVRNAFSHSDYILTDDQFRFFAGIAASMPLEELDLLMDVCFAFYGAFMYLHRTWLLSLAQSKKFHKWPNYEVLELLASEDEGLCGFSVHFSNGSKAMYARQRSGTSALNLHPEHDGTLNFFVGMLEELEPVWKINGKPVEDWNALP
jgi:hypothetical protein